MYQQQDRKCIQNSALAMFYCPSLQWPLNSDQLLRTRKTECLISPPSPARSCSRRVSSNKFEILRKRTKTGKSQVRRRR
ncbi:hypothetical protein MKW98_011282 [Papaver atlanticum]|uniref:Uncharacterized protein n=1 Tax=Papaver atlanticum TaxID=357466 RepID=A0AAD4XM47_9MAGN|nr:hypothetical protein MKW98_011282 [Papaver atlanticum]